jgi:hypothetical protein
MSGILDIDEVARHPEKDDGGERQTIAFQKGLDMCNQAYSGMKSKKIHGYGHAMV